MQTEKDKQELLQKIAKLLVEYEDPAGNNCSNDTMVEVSFDFLKEVYIFNGESFDRVTIKME